MPVIKLENKVHYSWAIWEISETENDLFAHSTLTAEESFAYERIRHEQKRKEFLAGRLVLKALAEKQNLPFKGIRKDDCGKPFLIDSNVHISLSHSYPLAGAILNLEKEVGIDIESPKEKLKNIAPKFLSQEELTAAGENLDKLCLFWCAKEVLYKIYGRKQLIFNKHLSVTFGDGFLEGKINLAEINKIYRLHYTKILQQYICFNEA